MSAILTILEGKDRSVHAVAPDATVLEAVEQMCRYHVGALLVGKPDGPIGIFSERDLMKRVVLEKRDPTATRVQDVMTRDIVCIDPSHEPEAAMAVMTERRVRHLPVLEGKLVIGIISIGDLVRWVTRSQDYEIRSLMDYVTGAYPG